MPLADYGVRPPPAPSSLKRYGRLERLRLLHEGRPKYLFCALQGGAAGSASAFVLRVS